MSWERYLAIILAGLRPPAESPAPPPRADCLAPAAFESG